MNWPLFKRIVERPHLKNVEKEEHVTSKECHDRELLLRSEIFRCIEQKPRETVLSNSEWVELWGEMDKQFPGFIHALCSKCSMTEREYKVCALIKLRINPARMGEMLACSRSSITNARRRLSEKMFQVADPKLVDKFIWSL
jgi:hypothetical protein